MRIDLVRRMTPFSARDCDIYSMYAGIHYCYMYPLEEMYLHVEIEV